MIVLDASVIIAQLDSTDAHHLAATELLEGNADQRWGASAVTLSEVLVGPARSGAGGRIEALLARWGIEPIAIPADAPLRLAELRARTSAKLPDCCVLLAAAQTGASVATFDDRLARAALSQGLTVTTG